MIKGLKYLKPLEWILVAIDYDLGAIRVNQENRIKQTLSVASKLPTVIKRKIVVEPI